MPLSKIEDLDKLRRLLDAVLVLERDLSLRVVLETLVRESCELVSAQYGALGVLDSSGGSVCDFITYGMDAATEAAIGEIPTGKGVLGLLVEESKPIRLADISSHPKSWGFPKNHPKMTSFLGVPVTVGERIFGNLYLTNKQGADSFDDSDEVLVGYLARAAGIAIENARLHSAVADLAMRADRERIARELHDEIIQRLFAIGLSLQATMRLIADQDANDRVQAAVDDLDEAIKRIRATIFALETTRSRSRDSFRAQILALVHELHTVLGYEPSVSFTGPLDTMVTSALATQALSVIREALANVAKHSRASAASVSVTAGDNLVIEVEDNGRGITDTGSPASKGLKNMAERASNLGGSFGYSRSDNLGGALIKWSAPL